MADVAGTGSASLAAFATGLKSVQTDFAASVDVLDTILKTETKILDDLLKSLGVGTQIDITA